MGACLHEVAGRDCLADVSVVVARVEVGADKLGAEPGRNPDLHAGMQCMSEMLLPSVRYWTVVSHHP